MLSVPESSDDGPKQDPSHPHFSDKLISCSVTNSPLLQLSRFLCSFLLLSFFFCSEVNKDILWFCFERDACDKAGEHMDSTDIWLLKAPALFSPMIYSSALN